MTQDRTYWRAQDSKRLIDEAKHYPCAELCIALGERLEEANADAGLIDDLKSRVDLQQASIFVMRAEIEALERQIDELMGATDND